MSVKWMKQEGTSGAKHGRISEYFMEQITVRLGT